MQLILFQVLGIMRFLGVAVALAPLIGCAPASQGPGGARGGDGPPKRFIVLMNNNSPFWDAVGKGVEMAARELGVTAILETNDGTEQGQINSLKQFGTQSDIAAVGISVLKADVAAIADEMRALQSKGVKVITIDSDVNREFYRDARAAFVGTNNFEAGRELGKAAKALKPGGAKYVTFVGQLTAQNAIERIGGFAEGAGESFLLVDKMEDSADRERAKENVRNAMTNHPEVDMLVGIWSYNAPAIADVLVERQRQNPQIRAQYTICTFDAEPIAIEHMENGAIDVMLVQDPYAMGYEGVRLMKALVDDDRSTIAEMLPQFGNPDGDIFDTALRVVVPDADKRLHRGLFGPSVEFFKLADFRAWLAERGLQGS